MESTDSKSKSCCASLRTMPLKARSRSFSSRTAAQNREWKSRKTCLRSFQPDSHRSFAIEIPLSATVHQAAHSRAVGSRASSRTRMVEALCILLNLREQDHVDPGASNDNALHKLQALWTYVPNIALSARQDQMPDRVYCRSRRKHGLLEEQPCS